jgi:hypothetical protein
MSLFAGKSCGFGVAFATVLDPGVQGFDGCLVGLLDAVDVLSLNALGGE